MRDHAARLALAVVCLLSLAPPAAAQAAATVVSAGPTGELAQLDQANEVRIVFSEPMVVLGQIPQPVRVPFVRIRPAMAGEFRWSGTTVLHANAWCPARASEWVAVESDRLPCSWHHQTDDGLLVVWPARYRTWAADRGLLGSPEPALARTAPGTARTSRTPGTPGGLVIVSPPDGATSLIDPTLRREFQTLPLRASAAGSGTIAWRVNGKAAGESAVDAPVMWPLRPGRHIVSARDARGRTAETTIVVR